MVIATIIIPIALLKIKMELNGNIIPIFIILYIFFKFLNNNAHKLYLHKENEELKKQVEEEKKEEINYSKTIKNILILIATGVLLFIVGEQLGNTLETLCKLFNIPEVVVGILLGFITSIPELITFFESQKHHQRAEDNMLGVVEATNNLLTSNTLNLFIVQTISIIFTVNN